jgi:YesN/AraC family two-component response regulator
MYTILIVDDETLIRKSIVAKLKKSSYEFKALLEARNANDALQFTNIDILITDIRMGIPNGLELARKMKQNNPSLKTIIISGYSEFTYATQALSIGVIDYLIKPINTEELLSSVAKAMGLLDQEKKEKTSQDKALIEESSANLSSVFQNSPNVSEEDLAPYLSIKRIALYLNLRLFIAVPNDNILYLVMNCIKESSFVLGYDIATYKDKLRQVGMLIALSEIPSDVSRLPFSVSDLVGTISVKLEEKGMHSYTFGVSEFSPDALISYEQSLEAMYHRILFPETHLVTYDTCSRITESFTLSKEDRTKFLLLLSTQAIPSLNLFIDKIEKAIEKALPVTYHSLQLLFNFFRDTISTTLHYHPSSFASSREPYQFNSIREMTDYLKSFCLRAIETSTVETNTSRTFQLVWKLQSIIKEHCEEQFTLELFCNQNNINTSFFSSQFHQIAGVTFQDYLNTTRIENAKRLLSQTDNKIGTVATLCGFSDQHYFSKTFKRLTGLTPKEFQAQSKERLSKQ